MFVGKMVMTILGFKYYLETEKPKGFWFLSKNQADCYDSPMAVTLFFNEVLVASVNPPLVVFSNGNNHMHLREVISVEKDDTSFEPLSVLRVKCRWMNEDVSYIFVESK